MYNIINISPIVALLPPAIITPPTPLQIMVSFAFVIMYSLLVIFIGLLIFNKIKSKNENNEFENKYEKKVERYEFVCFIFMAIIWLMIIFDNYGGKTIEEVFYSFMAIKILYLMYTVIRSKFKLRKVELEAEKLIYKEKIRNCYISFLVSSIVIIILLNLLSGNIIREV